MSDTPKFDALVKELTAAAIFEAEMVEAAVKGGLNSESATYPVVAIEIQILTVDQDGDECQSFESKRLDIDFARLNEIRTELKHPELKDPSDPDSDPNKV